MSLHIPWDKVDDYAALAAYAQDRGVALGAINANVFQDDDYMLGSVTNPDPGIRRKAIDHCLECVEIAQQTGSRDVKLWFSDGMNYPGQDNVRARQDRLAVALRETYDRLGDDQRILLEYKLFEPAFYVMDVPDWGTSYAHCVELETGRWCASTPGTTLRTRTSSSSWRCCCGSGNSARSTSTAASMPTTTSWSGRGSVPAVPHHGRDHQADALRPEAGIAFMLDQCHNIEPKIPGQIRSIMNVQEATAKALLVDIERSLRHSRPEMCLVRTAS